MGKRGPAKTPAAIKMAAGTFRPDRDGAPNVGSELPVPPPWLSAESRYVWDIVVPQLAQIDGLLATIDAFALSRYCDLYCHYFTANRMANEQGLVTTNDKGSEYTNPAFNSLLAIETRLARCEAKFGMTASDRSGMRLQTKRQVGVRRREA